MATSSSRVNRGSGTTNVVVIDVVIGTSRQEAEVHMHHRSRTRHHLGIRPYVRLPSALPSESCLCQEAVRGRVDGPERRLGVALLLVREWLFRSAGVQGLCRPRWIQRRALVALPDLLSGSCRRAVGGRPRR